MENGFYNLEKEFSFNGMHYHSTIFHLNGKFFLADLMERFTLTPFDLALEDQAKLTGYHTRLSFGGKWAETNVTYFPDNNTFRFYIEDLSYLENPWSEEDENAPEPETFIFTPDQVTVELKVEFNSPTKTPSPRLCRTKR